jgi:hypothetical protein
MSTHVSIEQADRRTLACKRATSPGDVDAIRAEAGRLADLDHPGIVRFVELRETDDGPRLVTEYVGPRTLATMGPVTTERAAGLVADLAATVADLHGTGVVHGDVRPEHVIVAGDHVVLCSPASDPDDLTTADDVLGIGHCLQAVLEPDLDEEPIPDRRPWKRTPWVGYRHRSLLTLADQATADEPGRRPSARALADAVAQAGGAPTAADPVTSERRPALSVAQQVSDLVAVRLRRHPDRPRPRRRIVVLAAVGVTVLAVGVTSATGRASTPSTAPTGAAPDVGCGPGPDLDGDGCPEAIRLGHGWLEVDGQRYRVGRPGNALAIGDWDGDGRATVALLQRGTGQVWRFARWDPDAAVTAEPAGGYPGAIDLAAEPLADRDRLVVELRDGSTAEVPG